MSLQTKICAKDLLELAKEDNSQDLYQRTLEKINNAANKDPQFAAMILSEDKSVGEKKDAIMSYFENTLNSEVINTFFISNGSIGKSRTELDLIHDFLASYYQLKGMLFGVVYSVRPLDLQQIRKIESALSQQLEQGVRLENKIDDQLLGGVKVVINNNVWDGSYKSKLSVLKSELLAEEEEMKATAQNMGVSIKESISNFSKQQVSVQSSDMAGYVTTVADGIVNISGIYKAMSGELLQVGSATAMVMNLEEENIGAVLLTNSEDVVEGSEARSTGRVVEVPVGDALLGRVVDALGNPIDGKGSIRATKYMPIEKPAPGVLDRQSVSQPLETGLKVIDSMIPVGKGQRELIIGDRQTGKTAIAIDTILNQRGKNVKCVYVAIGQKNSTVAQIVEKLKQNSALSYTTIVVAGASDLPALQYIAPYTGCTIGEYWMNNGQDVLVVYDDLSKHAVAYRTLSLLLRRPPGREAYPGDVFYLHSRLLERSAKLSNDLGGGSLTALPIIETQAGDISAYIPTNVISITDGQIFLQTELFNAGTRPAVDSGLSVSRVGSSAQNKAMKKVSSSLKLDLAQYQEVLDFAQFGSDLDAATKKTISHGQHLMELLKQPQYSPASVEDQIIMLFANQKGFLDTVEVEQVKEYEKKLLLEIHSVHPEIIQQLETEKQISDSLAAQMSEAIEQYTTRFRMMVK